MKSSRVRRTLGEFLLIVIGVLVALWAEDRVSARADENLASRIEPIFWSTFLPTEFKSELGPASATLVRRR